MNNDKYLTSKDFLIYKDSNNNIKVDVLLINNDMWLTQDLIAQLFGKDQSGVSLHINNIFKTGELSKKSNMQKMHTPNSDKPVIIYNLDVIIAVGYRVNSKEATNFRIWATKVLREYISDFDKEIKKYIGD